MKAMWKCDVCGYIHSGDYPPEKCPICGVGADLFSAFTPVVKSKAPVLVERWRCSICGYIHTGSTPPDICPLCAAVSTLFEPEGVEEHRDEGYAGHIVIIGAGIAGVTAAEYARKSSSKAKITLVNNELSPPYYRMNLTRYLAGDVGDESLGLYPQDWYEANRIDIVNLAVQSITREYQLITLIDYSVIQYDRLIIANGSHCFIPSFEGIGKSGVFSLRTKKDADDIKNACVPGSSCVIVGGGILGIEVAGALNQSGVEVVILEGHTHLLPRQLPPGGGVILQELLEEREIVILLNARTDEIRGAESVESIVLADGREVAANHIVVSTGVRPNSYLARSAGLKVGRGIVVDSSMQTSVSNIYAAGDVAEYSGRCSGIWPVSYAQGMVAGCNAAGGAAEYEAEPPSNMLKVVGIDLFSVGVVNPPDGSYEIIESSAGGNYCAVVIHDGYIVGAALLGDISQAETLKCAVAGKRPIVECDFMNSEFDWE